MGCHFLPQGAFPTQGLNPGLLHCRQILDRLSHQGRYCISSITGLIWPMWKSKHQASCVFCTQMVGSRDVTQNEPGSLENIPLKHHAVLCPHRLWGSTGPALGSFSHLSSRGSKHLGPFLFCLFSEMGPDPPSTAHLLHHLLP